jgi:outer membrane protein X
MKKNYVFLLASMMVLSVSGLKAQSTNYKPFKVDLAVGYAVPTVKGSKSGAVIAIEPKYSIDNNITLGLRLEGALTASAYESGTTVFVGRVNATSSYLATADYFFEGNKVRPFAGLGLGLFSTGGVGVVGDKYYVSGANKFGVAPRAGIEVGHFRAAAEYNVMGKEAFVNYNYLSFKVGFFLGGGKK